MGTIFAGLLGLAFGSFLNVCLSRWPEEESIVQPRSHCRHCSHALAWWENIPLLSWILLRGRCRECRSWIGWRYPIVECAVGSLWAVTAWHGLDVALDPLQPTAEILKCLTWAIGQMIFYWLMVALAALDAENLWLPDWLTLPGVALGFSFTLAAAILNFRFPASGSNAGNPGLAAATDLLAIFAAAFLILFIRWIYQLARHREGMGLGDAKLMALLAAWLGLPQTLLAFGLGVVMGAMVGTALLAYRNQRGKLGDWALSKLPLGTFLAIAGVISGLWGKAILDAYLSFAGI